MSDDLPSVALNTDEQWAQLLSWIRQRNLVLRVGRGGVILEPSPMSENEIFVFGSNLAGRHGAGAALAAKHHYGAENGVGVGLRGRSYAIPTKDEKIHTLPLDKISAHVRDFLEFARSNPDMTFRVTAIGTGLAGYRHEQIAPMFKGAPQNCRMPIEWEAILADAQG